MCGFFQAVHKNGSIDRERFVKALNSMRHRGPDAEGIHYAEFHINDGYNYQLAFGHRRLSILDLSASANQPYHYDSRVLLFNGEIYNFQQLAVALKKQNIALETHGDTEVLMKYLAHYPDMDSSLPGFNGMWAFSLFDANKHEFWLSRDRYGKKPLFYYCDKKVFCASSSIRAIKIYLGMTLSFRHEALRDYILFGTLYPGNTSDTHFQSISQILPGHYAHFDCKNWTLKQTAYFDFTKAVQQYSFSPDLSLAATLQSSVEARLVSDRPIALLLSGGVDSSLLLSIMASLGLHDQVKIFMGDTGRSEDYEYAKRSVEQLGIDAETVVLDYNDNTFERFLKVCWHHEKPFPLNGNAMAMPQMFEVIAAQGIPVVLDGSGGDEVFGGYWERHMPSAMRQALDEGNTSWTRSMVAHNGAANRVKESLHQARLPLKFYNYKYTLSKRLGKTLHPLIKTPPSEIWQSSDPDPLTRAYADFSIALSMDVSPGGRLAEWIWHNDRNSMMSSVESRSPLLDYRLHKFLFSGYSKKYHKQWNKYELRQVFDHFEKLPTQWRTQKQGFRWDGKHFIRNNRDRIIELIDNCESLDDVLNTGRLVKLARKYPKILRSSIGKQALCIAGVEQTLMKTQD